MLHLEAQTPSEWVGRALTALDEVLLDHTHLEKKAAANALNLIFRYPEHADCLARLSALAREELEHFELMLEHLKMRGIPFVRMKPSAYPGRLRKVIREDEPERLLDLLLCSAMIEARSCERMKMLADGLGSDPARPIYQDLLAQEARHHMLYVDLAGEIFGDEVARRRLSEVASFEAEVIRTARPENRLHG